MSDPSSIQISIITPVYDNVAFIECCIKNVCQQDCSNLEHIIVDGGSTDGTLNVIKDYAEKFPHIRWHSEPDQGQSSAINRGIRMARGELIGLLNSDDFYEEDAVSKVKKILPELPEPSFIVGNCRVVGINDQIKNLNIPRDLTLFNLLTYRCPHPCNPSAYFYHKSLHNKVGFYDIEDHYTMDLDFILRILPHCHIEYINEILGNFREIPGTKTSKSKETHQHFIRKSNLIRKHQCQLPKLESIFISMTRKTTSTMHFLKHPNSFLNYIAEIKNNQLS
ncbi:MAG: glycosyltransferase family 2 protein [Leptolyngbyaceae cyanobacterium]